MLFKRPFSTTLFSAFIIVILLLSIHQPTKVQASINPVVSETGYISWSVDGLGTNSTGTIQVQKPVGATVRGAYVAASSSPGQTTPNGGIEINGNGITWDDTKTVAALIGMTNYWADVTSIVKPIVDGAAAGTINLSITDINNTNEALALIVIFDDPNQTSQNTVILLSGAQDPAGDTSTVLLANPINKSAAGFAMDMSLGIAFGYQPIPPNSGGLGQYSIVKVNDILITSSAGGQDDSSANGNLATVGGYEDSNTNPADPASTTGNYRTDDELYSLIPFVNDGETSITTYTQNPSKDDNIFFIGYFFGANTALIGDETDPGILNISPNSGPITGGTSVTITGINFTGTTSVTFGGTPVVLSSCVITDTSIVCPTPAHVEGLVSVSVTTPEGTATLNDSFTYQVATVVVPKKLPSELPTTGFPKGTITRLPIQPMDKNYLTSGMTLEIPKLNVTSSIVEVPLVDNNWDVTWLASKTGYLQGSAFPTWAGNTVLTGHVWDADNTPGVFANLKLLNYGDQIKIQAFGATYTYEVRENLLSSSYKVKSVFKHEELDWITLLTCEGFDPASESYSFRRVVRAVLINVE